MSTIGLSFTVIKEVVDYINIDEDIYDHEEYSKYNFDADKKIAASHNFDDTIIRTIKLTRA